MIQLKVNGKDLTLPPKTTVTKLLKGLKISSQTVVVEKNGQILDKNNYSKNLLGSGDQVEIIQMIGGGCL